MRGKGGRRYSMAEWTKTVYTYADFRELWGRRGWECVQAAGELMFVPAMLSHATLNLGEVLALAVTNDPNGLPVVCDPRYAFCAD